MKKGFTLIEVLISIGILSVISLVLSQSFLSTTRGSMKSEIQSSVKQSGDFAVKTMEQMIRQASSISPATCTSLPLKTLELNNPDGGVTTFRCLYVNPPGITRIASVSGLVNPVTYYLTSSDVTLGGTGCNAAAMTLSFTCTAGPGIPDKVLINFTLSQAGTAHSQAEAARTSFQTTVNVRN